MPLLGGAGGGALGAVPLAGGVPVARGVRGERLLHRLLEQGLQVGRDAGPGGLAAPGARGGVRGFALLAEGVEQRLPLPRLVEEVLDPWHQVLHAAGQLGVADVPHGVEDFELAYAQP